MEHLVFQLYGPMAAWGEIAVGERRASSAQPSKSAIVGLVGAALGIRREEEERHRSLGDTYGMAVRINARGEFLRDYHTTQVPTTRDGRTYYTRRDEIAAAELHTILSQRDYRVDSCYTVALWKQGSNEPYTLKEIGEALAYPQFILYLGRKSCPLAVPVCAQVVDSETLLAAFSQATFPGEMLGGLPTGEMEEYVWEYHPDPGLKASMVYLRRDHVLSRRRWQFGERDEYYVAVAREGIS